MLIGEQQKLSDSGLSWILLLFNKISDHGRKDWLGGCHFRLCFAVWSSVCGAAAFDAVSQVLRGLHRRDLCYKRCAKQLKNISSSFTKIKKTTLCIWSSCTAVMYLLFFLVHFVLTMLACELVTCVCVQFSVRKKIPLVFSIQSLTLYAVSVWVALFFSVCDGFGKQIRLLLWSIIWAFSSFFVTLPVVPLF